MASNVTVNLGAGRKVLVKTTPQTTLKEIRDTACAKQGIKDAAAHGLRATGNRKDLLDLSLSVRLANLAPGAKLDLAFVGKPKEDTLVDIALQLEDQPRLVGKFAPTTSVWSVLRQFEQTAEKEGKKLLLTRASADINNSGGGVLKNLLGKKEAGKPPVYLQPVCILMNKEYSSIESMLSVTLQDAGISGNGVIRVSLRPTEQPYDQAIANIESLEEKALGKGVAVANEAIEQTPFGMDTSSSADATGDAEKSPEAANGEKQDLPSLPQSGSASTGAATAHSTSSATPLDASSHGVEIARRGEGRGLTHEAHEDGSTNGVANGADAYGSIPSDDNMETFEPSADSGASIDSQSMSFEEHRYYRQQQQQQQPSQQQPEGQVASTIEAKKAEESSNAPSSAATAPPAAGENSSTSEVSSVALSILTPSTTSGASKFERDVVIYSAPKHESASNRFDLPDSFYELTPDELKFVWSQQETRRKMIENAPLKTKAMREKDQREKEKKYPKTMIRVRFPNHLQLQAAFISSEPISAVYELVRKSIISNQVGFYLYVTPPKRILQENETSLFENELAPASVVYFSWQDNSLDRAYLKDELVAVQRDLEEPGSYVAAVEGTSISSVSLSSVATSSAEDDKKVGNINTASASNPSLPSKSPASDQPSSTPSKFPKWFKTPFSK